MIPTINYKTTENIEEATHWLSSSDGDSVVENWIIPNKFYKIYKLKDELTNTEEFYIIGEDGHYSMYYLCYDGNFVIKKE